MENDAVKDALDYADASLDEGEYADPFEAVAQEELVTQLWCTIIACVGIRDTRVFIEHEFDGKTFKEISKEFGMSKANAERIYNNVFEKMKGYRVLDMLFNHGFEEEVYRICLNMPLSEYFEMSDRVHTYVTEKLIQRDIEKALAEREQYYEANPWARKLFKHI